MSVGAGKNNPSRNLDMEAKNWKLLYTLTRGDLSIRWKCSRMTVIRLEKSGRLPALRIGGLVRYRLTDVERIESEGGSK